ncbi:MAG: sigma-70 family RNA polymerase sigma factor [Anaerotignum sp.]|nr:sigma-70 family RNA polymerase sigma factor [Anaerotignum sp.]
MDEKKLLELLQKKPNEGMKALMAKYMGYCYHIVKNRLAGFPQEDIEECVSDVFLDAYRYRAKIDMDKGGFRGFLAVVARRRAADRFDAAMKKGALPLEESFEKEEKGLSFEEKEMLLAAIRALGDPDEKILIWKYYYGYPTRKIAAALGLKENTVDQKVKRGLEKLRKTLEGGGFYEG